MAGHLFLAKHTRLPSNYWSNATRGGPCISAPCMQVARSDRPPKAQLGKSNVLSQSPQPQFHKNPQPQKKRLAAQKRRRIALLPIWSANAANLATVNNLVKSILLRPRKILANCSIIHLYSKMTSKSVKNMKIVHEKYMCINIYLLIFWCVYIYKHL